VRREVGDQRLLVPVLDGHAFPGAHAEQIKAQLRRINQITKEQLELFSELTDLINQHAPQLLKQRSIGTVTAAVIIGLTAGAQRFRSEACFARHAGTAPIPATSGNTVRYRLHRGGDRQLNRAIHIIALGRVAWDPQTRAYIQRKASRRQDQAQGDPLPQTPHRPPDLASALQHLACTDTSPATTDPGNPGTHAVRPLTRK
jgi:transposase